MTGHRVRLLRSNWLHIKYKWYRGIYKTVSKDTSKGKYIGVTDKTKERSNSLSKKFTVPSLKTNSQYNHVWEQSWNEIRRFVHFCGWLSHRHAGKPHLFCAISFLSHEANPRRLADPTPRSMAPPQRLRYRSSHRPQKLLLSSWTDNEHEKNFFGIADSWSLMAIRGRIHKNRKFALPWFSPQKWFRSGWH